jgi:hypothetical protein
MPFYCGKLSAGICVVLGPKKSSRYSSEYASGFFSRLWPRICQHLLCLATKDYSDRLLGFVGISVGLRRHGARLYCLVRGDSAGDFWSRCFHISVLRSVKEGMIH